MLAGSVVLVLTVPGWYWLQQRTALCQDALARRRAGDLSEAVAQREISTYCWGAAAPPAAPPAAPAAVTRGMPWRATATPAWTCASEERVTVDARLINDGNTSGFTRYDVTGFVRNTCTYGVQVRLEITGFLADGTVIATMLYPPEPLALGAGEERAFVATQLALRRPPDLASMRVVPKVSAA